MKQAINMNSIETVKGSGNVFADFGHPDAQLLHLKALLGAKIVRTLDARGLTVRKAGKLARIAAGDISRICAADLGRFTVDRLITVLSRLGQRVNVSLTIRPDERT